MPALYIPHTVAAFVGTVVGASELVYSIGGEYSKFNVDFAIDDRDSPGPVHFERIGDDRTLANVDANSTSRQVPQTISVAGVHQLTLVASTNDPNGAKLAGYGNARLLP
jgi:hypothetical protein